MAFNFKKADFILVTISLFIIACAPVPATTPIVEPINTPSITPTSTSTVIPTVTYTPTPDISNLPIDEIIQLYMDGKIEYPIGLSDSQEAELSGPLIEYINQNTGHSVHVTKTFKGVDYNIYWSPIRGQWRSDHNTPIEQLDLTGDSFPELIAAPNEVVLESINLPGLGEKSLAEIYQMSDAELKKYVIGLVIEGKKASNPSITPEKLKEIEKYFNDSNTKLLPVIIDPNNSQQNDVYTLWFSPAQGPKASIPEASVTFHDGRRTNTVLMPILNNSGEIICFVRIHQTSEIRSVVTEFSASGAFATDGYPMEDLHVFGNTNGDSFAILVYDTAGPFEDVSTGPILEGEEGIGDATTIEKLKNAHSLEEVMAVLEEIRLIALQTTRAVIERE